MVPEGFLKRLYFKTRRISFSISSPTQPIIKHFSDGPSVCWKLYYNILKKQCLFVFGVEALYHHIQPEQGRNKVEEGRPSQYPSLTIYRVVFTSLFIAQIFIEILHCVRHQTWSWGCRSQQDRYYFPLNRAYIAEEWYQTSDDIIVRIITIIKDRYAVLWAYIISE